MLRHRIFYNKLCRHLSTTEVIPRVCIVGTGPAGIYTCKRLTKLNEKVEVDMYERLPVPFGLVRYGVAPDHPEIKLAIKQLSKYSTESRVRFIGNVEVGKDISVTDLRKAYHAIVFAYGANSEKKLKIPGEEHILSAPSVVGWYNGIHEYNNVKLDLDVEEIALIGHGNVAIDISRILLTNIDVLKKTDITERALEELSKSRVRRVCMIGRRGPLQGAFTIAEVREMIELDGCDTILDPDDFASIRLMIPNFDRAKKRLMQLLVETVDTDYSESGNSKKFQLKFCRSPLEVVKDGKTLNLKLMINTLEGEGVGCKAQPTGQTEVDQYGMVIRSVGYLGESIDPCVPFDASRGIIPNQLGRVNGQADLYCSGWIKNGPVGVLLAARNSAVTAAESLADDISKKILPIPEKRPGYEFIEEILRKKGIQTVTFQDWEKINEVEVKRGEKLGKPREKILSISEMLEIARS